MPAFPEVAGFQYTRHATVRRAPSGAGVEPLGSTVYADILAASRITGSLTAPIRERLIPQGLMLVSGSGCRV
jgi:hypothetical protein